MNLSRCLALWGASLLVACGSVAGGPDASSLDSSVSDGPGADSGGTPDGTVGRPDAGTPEGLDAGGGLLSPLDGDYSLSPAPCDESAPRFLPGRHYPHACSMRAWRPDGGLGELERRDEQGNVVEHSYWEDNGYRSTERTWYQDGRPFLRLYSNAWGDSRKAEWVYDAEGREIARSQQYDDDPPIRWLTFYRTDGGIDRVDTYGYRTWGYEPGALTRRDLYHYDPSGRLISIETTDCDCDATESFEYFPSGQLRRHTHSDHGPFGGGTSFDLQYDEAGHLLYEMRGGDDSGWKRESSYAGNLLQSALTTHWPCCSANQYELERLAYDVTGRLLLRRVALDEDDWETNSPDPIRLWRTNRRYVYGCASGQLVREEVDTNEDGLIEGTRALEYDWSGNLLRERYTGSESQTFGERVYGYECFP
ncbi:MAG: hypothetical protein QM765_21190 [Myxococcales bacterium]